MSYFNPGNKDEVLESYHEVFIGYESGAIGLFRISLESSPKVEGAPVDDPLAMTTTFKIQHTLMIAP
jgi:hypothetical protein